MNKLLIVSVLLQVQVHCSECELLLLSCTQTTVYSSDMLDIFAETLSGRISLEKYTCWMLQAVCFCRFTVDCSFTLT